MKNKKILSVLLTVLLAVGNMAFFPVSAQNVTLSENFNSVNEKTDLAGKTVNGLTWAFSDGTIDETFTFENRSGNDKALKVGGSGSSKGTNAEKPLLQVYSGLDYSEGDVELNLSLDIKLDKGAYYDLTLAGSDLSEADELGKGTQSFVSFCRWSVEVRESRWTNATTPKLADYTENQWFTLGLRQQKLSNGNFKKMWYVDGALVKTLTDSTEYQFDKLVLSGGGLNSDPEYTYNFAIDNVKFWSQSEYSATLEKHIDTAQELLAAAGTTNLTVTDVDAGYGKPGGATAIQLSGTGNASPAVGIAPTADEDVIVEFDLLLNQPSDNWHLGFHWGSDTYLLKNGQYLVNARNLGLNQWNNMKFRAYYDVTDSKYKWQYYCNGVLIDTTEKDAQSGDFTVTKFWLWLEKEGTMRIDDLCIKSVMASNGAAYCAKDTHKVSLLDWTGIPSGSAYGNALYNSGYNCSQYVNYTSVYDATYNAQNVTAVGRGKDSSDVALKMGRAAGAGAVNMRVTFDTNNELIPAFQSGSTVRFGTSVLLGDHWLSEDTDGAARINRAIELRVINGENITYANGTLAAQIVIGSTGLMRYQGYGESQLSIVTNKMSAKKWYRLEYELAVGDGSTTDTTVNIYVDGVKVNDEPISLGKTAVSDAMLHVYANHGSSNDAGIESDFYIDDLMFEYIPSGENAYSAICASPTSLNNNIMPGKGVISLLDAAESTLTAADLAIAVTGSDVSVVNSSGTALTTESAKGAYLKVKRSGMPDIYYLANDLSVSKHEGVISADMLFAGDGNATVFIAVYNSDGSLDHVALDGSGDDLLRVSAEVSEGQSYKVFLWGAGMVPYFECFDSENQ